MNNTTVISPVTENAPLVRKSLWTALSNRRPTRAASLTTSSYASWRLLFPGTKAALCCAERFVPTT
jgi:hypothetical protein